MLYFQGTSEEPGILPRTLDVVFNSIQCCSDVQFKPKCYSEVLYLNDTEQEQELIFKQDLLRKVIIEFVYIVDNFVRFFVNRLLQHQNYILQHNQALI